MKFGFFPHLSPQKGKSKEVKRSSFSTVFCGFRAQKTQNSGFSADEMNMDDMQWFNGFFDSSRALFFHILRRMCLMGIVEGITVLCF